MTRVVRVLRGILLAAIVGASAFLARWTWRTTAALERLGERSIIESTVLLVREKLDRVEAQVITADRAVLHLVDPDDLERLASRWPDLAERISPAVRAVLVLDHEGRALRCVSRRGARDAERFTALVQEHLRPELRLEEAPAGTHRHWHGAVLGQAVLVTHFTRETDGRRWHVVLETDLEFMREEVFPKLFDDPMARGRFNVTDESNRIVVGRPLTAAGDFLVSMRFPTTLYKWRLSVAPRFAPEFETRARTRRRVEAFSVALSLSVIVLGVSFLIWAVRKEERLNRLKSDFIATVSHELKTPLALIRMFGEMLASGRVPTDEKRAQYLDIIVRESERLTALIENVLDFARLERGRSSFEFVEGDLGAAVERAVEQFRYRSQRERPALECEVDEALPRVRLDERAVQLLVFNLLDNAFKYAGDSDAVRVRVRRDSGRLVLDVEDHGPGIDPDDARRVFERFYRGKVARSGSARGSGIGLALVKHIAQAHGGDVSVHPASPTGAVFRVTIPVEHAGR